MTQSEWRGRGEGGRNLNENIERLHEISAYVESAVEDELMVRLVLDCGGEQGREAGGGGDLHVRSGLDCNGQSGVIYLAIGQEKST
jgi:hypothetical protein